MSWPRGRRRKPPLETDWAILCPGPSLGEHDLRELNYTGGVVAVTEALFADAPITHFCHPEGPNQPTQARCRRYGPRLRELGPITLWCGKDHWHRWKHWRLPEANGEWYEFTWKAVVDDQSIPDMLAEIGYPTPQHWRRDAFARGPTPWAILRAMIAGARLIELYGCDQTGLGNFDPRTHQPIPNRKSAEWWTRRWVRERRQLAELIEACSLCGVKIRRVQPRVVA